MATRTARIVLMCAAGAVLALLLAIGFKPAAAQTQKEELLSFDVASIKPLAFEPLGGGRIGGMGGGPPMALIRARLGAASLRFTPGRVASAPAGVTAGTIIREAYRLTPLELSPGPDWIYTDPFDLEAKAESANEDQLRLMLRTLLTERFQLAMHRDSKVLPVYALRIGKKGARLREWKTGDAMPGFNSKGHAHSFIDRGAIERLIRTMSGLAGRPILDKTGLTGVYVFHVEWDEGQDFLAAMLKQLGLRLESQKAPVDIFTIDRIEQPSAN